MPLDITTFAPLSVKSGGDFEDILADGDPAIWVSSRPAQRGETGALFARIIERALAMKAERLATEASQARPRRTSAKKRGA